MNNSPSSNNPCNTPNTPANGITEIRQRTIAALIARGFSVKYVAKKLKISESRIYHLLSDKDSLVNAEINRVLKELFAGDDRRLVNLFDKALQKLDAMLSSCDEEKQFRAIDRIIRIYLTRSAKHAVTIQQYFGIQSQEEDEKEEKRFIKRIDDLILKKRKERGLPEWPDDEDSPDSSPDDSFPGASSTDGSPSENRLPVNSPADGSSAKETAKFLEPMK